VDWPDSVFGTVPLAQVWIWVEVGAHNLDTVFEVEWSDEYLGFGEVRLIKIEAIF
jgi:hypothetical protein